MSFLLNVNSTKSSRKLPNLVPADSEDNAFHYQEQKDTVESSDASISQKISFSQKMTDLATQLKSKSFGKKTESSTAQQVLPSNALAPNSKAQAADLLEPLTKHEPAHEDALLAESLEAEFFTAAEQGKVELLTELLNQGVNVNAARPQDGLSPLQLACSQGQDMACAVLLLRGALVNAFNPRTGWTALHAAACRGDAVLAKRLLQAGAMVEARTNDGRTALHFACEAGSQHLVKELLLANAHTNACTHDGKTPLHYACIEGNLECVKRLLAAGAQEVKDMPGREPVELAQQVGHEAIVKLLLKRRKKGAVLPESLIQEVEEKKSQPTIPVERWFVLNDNGKMLETEKEKVALFNSRAAAANWAVRVCEDSFQVAEIMAEKWPIFQREVDFEWCQEDEDPLWEEYWRKHEEKASTKEEPNIDVYEFTRRQEEQALVEKIAQIQQEIEDVENRKQQALDSCLKIQEESKIINERCLVLESKIQRFQAMMHEDPVKKEATCLPEETRYLEEQHHVGEDAPSNSSVVAENEVKTLDDYDHRSPENHDALPSDKSNEDNVEPIDQSQQNTEEDDLDNSMSQVNDGLTDKEVSDITSAVDQVLLQSQTLINSGLHLDNCEQQSAQEDDPCEKSKSHSYSTFQFQSTEDDYGVLKSQKESVSPPAADDSKTLDDSKCSALTDEEVSEITSAVDLVLLESQNVIQSSSMGADTNQCEEEIFSVNQSNTHETLSRNRTSSSQLLQVPLPFSGVDCDGDKEESHSVKTQNELKMWLQSIHIGKKDAECYAESLAKDGFDSLDALLLIAESDLQEYKVKKAHCRIILRHLSLANQHDSL